MEEVDDELVIKIVRLKKKKSKSVMNRGRSTKLEIPDREKREIERKGNFMIDLICDVINYFIVPLDLCLITVAAFCALLDNM